ncbi:hypothetical protein EC973_007340 [Apophysomyces ossiformis]|uniref:Alcohol acetyltransferase n=1 Tax=Apophysomyces ossiformis TaxID=679940 RepID=A0A8H7BPC8_9FUNG|nr:hypothetical protein EC973_007340 [Apophysomyces ossiformis]
MSNYTRQRKLGILEKYQVSKQLNNAYGNVVVMGMLQHESRPDGGKEFYLDKFYAALSKLIRDHPQLCLAVAEEDQPSAHFVHLTSFDFAEVLHLVEEPYWETQTDVLADECRIEFDLKNTTLPLWRLRVSFHPERPEECAVTLAIHHTMGDGMSLSIFWHEFLLHINTVEAVPRTTYVLERQAEAVPPPMEDRNPPTANVLDVLGTVLAGRLKALPVIGRLFGPTSWAGEFPAAENEMHHTVVRLAQVDGDAWAKLTQIAKQRKLSAHAVLYAALLLAWTDIYPDQKALDISTPINCRALCQPPVPKNELGNFVGVYERLWKRPFPEFWSLAEIYHKALQRSKPTATKKSTMLKFLPKYPESYNNMWYDKRKGFPMGRSGGLELSDLGRFECHEGDWQLKSIWFCQSSHTYTTAIGANTITANGSMYATIVWQKDSLDETKAEKFVSRFAQRLIAEADNAN